MARGALHARYLRRASRRTARYAAQATIAERIKPYKAGGLVKELKKLVENVEGLPLVRRSPDPTDDFLLAYQKRAGLITS